MRVRLPYNTRIIAQGYGRAAVESRRAKDISRCVRRLGGDKTIRYVYGYYEPGPYESQARTCDQSLLLSELLAEMSQSRFYSFGDFERIKTFSDIGWYWSDIDDICVDFIGTEKEYEDYRIEKDRKQYEQLASEVARKYRVKVDSIDFIKAVQSEIDAVNEESDQWNNPEVRMEEWAACQYAGGGSDTYYDDLNFVNGQFSGRLDDLYGILDWIAEACPLLWARYRESMTVEA